MGLKGLYNKYKYPAFSIFTAGTATVCALQGEYIVTILGGLVTAVGISAVYLDQIYQEIDQLDQEIEDINKSLDDTDFKYAIARFSNVSLYNNIKSELSEI